jgi:acyl-CoA thioesterase-2
MDAARHRWSTAVDLATTLDLELLDRDLYRGVNTVAAAERSALYGGQVAAQALQAAGMTVPPDRAPHSLHGYFLRPGQPDKPVLLHVDRDRDGGSFSARHVSAKQDGEVIFSMLASFHRAEPGGEYDALPTREAPPPDDCPVRVFDSLLEVREVRRRPATAPVPDGADRRGRARAASERATSRPPGGTAGGEAPGAEHTVPTTMWVRATAPLPAEPLTQACALAYISDLGSGFGEVDLPGSARGGPSIDHALWFQAPVAADDWLLLELWPAKAGGARGVYHGSVRDRSGRLGAELVQEMLLRLPRPGRATGPGGGVTPGRTPLG